MAQAADKICQRCNRSPSQHPCSQCDHFFCDGCIIIHLKQKHSVKDITIRETGATLKKRKMAAEPPDQPKKKKDQPPFTKETGATLKKMEMAAEPPDQPNKKKDQPPFTKSTAVKQYRYRCEDCRTEHQSDIAGPRRRRARFECAKCGRITGHQFMKEI